MSFSVLAGQALGLEHEVIVSAEVLYLKRLFGLSSPWHFCVRALTPRVSKIFSFADWTSMLMRRQEDCRHTFRLRRLRAHEEGNER